MPTPIRIERNTIKRNPYAGRTEWTSGGPLLAQVEESTSASNVVYQSIGLVQAQEKNGGVEVSGKFVVVTVLFTNVFSGMIYPGQKCERTFSSWTPGVTISLGRDVKHHRTIRPAPDWLYEYELTPITCNECGATFFHDKLKSNDDGGEDICPKCGEADCCDMAYEKIEDVVREMGLTA